MGKLNQITSKVYQPYVILMIGPPLVGKSTKINEFLSKTDDDVKVISRDDIVLELYGKDNYTEAFKSVDQSKVNEILYQRMVDFSKQKKNVIIDMMNTTRKRRKHNLSFFGDDYTKIAAICHLPTREELDRRNKMRSEKENKYIPSHILDSTISSYQPIQPEEGFNKVITI